MPSLVSQHAAARADVLEIYRRIAADNPNAADRFLDSLQEAYGRIALFPASGSLYHVPAKRQFRFVQVPDFRKYLVFYEESKNQVRVLYVLHGHRDLVSMLKSDRRR